MSKLVAHMGRMKKGNMSGIEGHNKRLFKTHSNKDIDTSKSCLNYELVTCSGSYLDAFNNEMDKYYTGKKAPRKDAVMCNEWIFSATNDFFENMPEDEEKRFFESCVEFMKERYGHVIYAVVHKDETTPHMHLGMIPITADGRLSNKSIFTRTELKSLHTALYEHLKSNGFNIEKPQPNDSKHLSVKDFKAKALDDKIAKNKQILQRQEQQYNDKRKQIDEYAKTKQNELKTNAQKEVDKINKYKADTFAEIDEREQALKERESSYKKEVDKQYQDEYNERKKTLDAFYAKENDKLTERESEVRYKEYSLSEREKDIEKRDEEVKRKEDDYRNKYNKSIKLVKQATAIEKRLDDKIGMYLRLQTSKYDSAFIQSLKLTMTDIYGKTQTDRIFDIARDNLDNINSVDTYEYDDYKLFKKQTVKSKQTDDLEL